MLDLDSKVKLFTEYLDNGGYERIVFPDLLESLMKVKVDTNGKVIESTVDSIVRSALNSYTASQMMEPFVSDEVIIEYESFLQKSIFFKQQKIDTDEELLDFINEFIQRENILYRGVREAKRRLYSSLQRHWITNKYSKQGISYKEYLKTLVTTAREAQKGTISNYLNKIGSNGKNDLAILAFLQHYEAPTPLLDWTYNFRNSLYFAIDGIQPNSTASEIGDYFSIYYIEEKYFSQTSLSKIIKIKLLELGDRERKKLEQIAMEAGVNPEGFDKLYAPDRLQSMAGMLHGKKLAEYITKIERLLNMPIVYFSDEEPNRAIRFGINNNIRIANQEGVFIWNVDPIKPLEHVASELFKSENAGEYSFCNAVNINKKLAPAVKEILDLEEINADYIYPNPRLFVPKVHRQTIEQITRGNIE